MKVCTLLFVSCLSNRQYLDGYHSAAVFAQEWDWVIPLDNQLFSAWDKLSNLKVECAVHHCAVMVASGFVCGVAGGFNPVGEVFLLEFVGGWGVLYFPSSSSSGCSCSRLVSSYAMPVSVPFQPPQARAKGP